MENNKIDIKNVERIAKDNKIGVDLAKLLYGRGMTTSDEVRCFLGDNKENIHSYKLLNNIEEAAEMIKRHISNGNKILIFGDYDVDGIFGSYVLKTAFGNYKEVYVHLPNRNEEGRNLEKEYAEKLIKDGFSLVITVDNGVSSIEGIKRLKEENVDVIITDHHKVGEQIPNADYIIDPQFENEGYPFKEICGAAVAFKVGQSINNSQEYVEKMTPLVGVATIADYMPLINENRFFAKKALNEILQNRTIRELYGRTSGKNITGSDDLSFNIINVLNSCGRISDPKFAYQLLNSENLEKYQISDVCEKLISFNEKRKELKAAAIARAKNENNLVYEDENFIITIQSEIESGIVGLVAMELARRENKNVFSLKEMYVNGKRILNGSVRGIGNCKLFDEIKNSDIRGVEVGGHQNSFGISIEPDSLNYFISLLKNFKITEQENYVTYDLEVNLEDINREYLKQFKLLEPTGNGNEKARFLLKGVRFRNISQYGNQITCQVVKGDKYLSCEIEYGEEPNRDSKYDIIINSDLKIVNVEEVGKLDENEMSRGFDRRDLSALGVTTAKKNEFFARKIYDVNDLLEKHPLRYIDCRKTNTAMELAEELKKENGRKNGSVIGTVKEILSGKKIKVIAKCIDETGEEFFVCWFSEYIRKSVFVGDKMLFTGRIAWYGKKVAIYPNYLEQCGRDIKKLTRIFPYYTSVAKPSNKYFIERISEALETTIKEDYLEQEVIEKFDLDYRKNAFRKIHQPENEIEIEEGSFRMAFDEMFIHSLNMEYNGDNVDKEGYKLQPKKALENFKKIIPFELTQDQISIMEDIEKVCSSGEKLNAILEANVGYGKTIVAIYLSILSAVNGYQSVVMAPTEILAKQHYKEFSKYLDSFGIRHCLLTSKKKKKEKNEALENIKNGNIKVIIGTTSVLSCEFNKLGSLIIDEEHKFGVEQRDQLKTKCVHILSLSATPIPRTVAMSVFGSWIKVYDIKERPKNRIGIKSILSSSKEDTDKYILETLNRNEQGFVVCPIIEENEMSEQNNVNDVYKVKKEVEELIRENGLNKKVEILTGKDKEEIADEKIEKFRNGEIDILVCTTVVENGIDIPNATLMVVKNSERFGIAQMHQLRGRVGRSDLQSYCVFETEKTDDFRTNIVISTEDGAEISKADAENRGYGDLTGTEQSGVNKIIPLIMKNEKLYEKIAEETRRIVADENRLNKYKEIIKKIKTAD